MRLVLPRLLDSGAAPSRRSRAPARAGAGCRGARDGVPDPGPHPFLDEQAQWLGRQPHVAEALVVLVQEAVDGGEKCVDELLELGFPHPRCRPGMQPGAGIDQPLAVRPAELIELLLEGPDDVEFRGTDLGQPLESLALVTERAARIEAPPVLDVVSGAEMPAGPPGAERLVPRVGGDECRRLECRTGIEPLGEWTRIDAAIGM